MNVLPNWKKREQINPRYVPDLFLHSCYNSITLHPSILCSYVISEIYINV